MHSPQQHIYIMTRQLDTAPSKLQHIGTTIYITLPCYVVSTLAFSQLKILLTVRVSSTTGILVLGLFLSDTTDQPKVVMKQATSPQNQFLQTITFGSITHRISPEPLNRARILQQRKAVLYPQPTLPVNSKAAPKQAGSEKSPAPRVQPESSSSNTKLAPTDVDTYTAVSNWLATSETFEKPPEPTPIADPVPPPRTRLDQEDWLLISEYLSLRIQSHAEQQLKTPNPPNVAYENHTLDTNITPSKLAEPADEQHTPPSQIDGMHGMSSYPYSPATMIPANEQECERETKRSIKGNVCPFEEYLETHEREREQSQQQLKGNESSESAGAVKTTTTKQLDAAKSPKNEDEEKEERKRYVESRAREIHEGMRLCKPFDVDSLRREILSEEEIGDVKRMVRELGFAEKKERKKEMKLV